MAFLPERDVSNANEYLDIVIPSGINLARNFIVQNSGSAIIMIGGGYGTLSELSYALSLHKKVISLKSQWENISTDIVKASSPKDAVEKAILNL